MRSKTRRCSTCRQKCDTSAAIISHLKAFCSYDCLTTYTRSKTAQKLIQKAQAQSLAERKEKLKTRSEWMTEAQAAFNAYIRVRDSNKCCISSGRPLVDSSVGGGYDAGHYRSRGAAGHLRFHLLNCWGQSKHDNRYLSGNISEYRVGLINRIGLQSVEKLEADNSTRSFDIEYLKRIKRIFNKRARLYKRLFR